MTTTGAPSLLALVKAYGWLTSELNVTYYLQDSDEITRLQAEVDRLEKELGIEWRDGEPITAIHCPAGGSAP